MTPYPTIESLGDRLGVAVARQFEIICRALLQRSGMTCESGFCRIMTGEPHPLGNFTAVSDPTDVDQTRRAIEPLCTIDAPSAAVFPGSVSDEVDTLLSESGFGVAERMPAMAVDLDLLARPELPPGHAFLEVDLATHREVWNETLAAGYEIPVRVAALFGPADAAHDPAADAVRRFAVMRDDVLVATSLIFIHDGLPGVYCVATRPESRGAGLGAFVTAEPLHLLRAEGYRVGVLQSSAMGESVYRRLGFESYGNLPLYVRMPAT